MKRYFTNTKMLLILGLLAGPAFAQFGYDTLPCDQMGDIALKTLCKQNELIIGYLAGQCSSGSGGFVTMDMYDGGYCTGDIVGSVAVEKNANLEKVKDVCSVAKLQSESGLQRAEYWNSAKFVGSGGTKCVYLGSDTTWGVLSGRCVSFLTSHL